MIYCTDGTLEKDEGRFPEGVSVALTVSEVSACFHGHAIDRGAAIAKLTSVQMVKLFPGKRIKAARTLARIARAIKPEVYPIARLYGQRALAYAAAKKTAAEQLAELQK